MGPKIIALEAIVLGLGTFYYLNAVVMPKLVPAEQTSPFPPCNESQHWYTLGEQGNLVTDLCNRFLCMIIPFFEKATRSPVAAFNWLQLLLLAQPCMLRMAEVLLTGSSAFLGICVGILVVGLGQIVGISVTFPLLFVPLFAWQTPQNDIGSQMRIALSGRNYVPPVVTTAMAWTLLIGVPLSALPLCAFFVFPHGSEWWIRTAVLFQPLPPLMFMLLGLTKLFSSCRRYFRHTSTHPSKAHGVMLGAYALLGGACVLAHVLGVFELAMHLSEPLPQMLTTAWSDGFVRFLLVDHITLALSMVLCMRLDRASVGEVLFVLCLAPLLSLGGAFCVFQARRHLALLVYTNRHAKIY